MSPTGNSKKRFNKQKSIMNNGELFKMICGAGNEDADEVYKLCLVYTLAGAKAIDMSANIDVVKSAVNGVEDAEALLGKYKLKNYTRPYLTVSIGMPGDHHVRKAKIIENDELLADKTQAIIANDIQEEGIVPERWIFITVEEAYIHCSKHIPHLKKLDKKIHWGTDKETHKGGDFFKAEICE